MPASVSLRRQNASNPREVARRARDADVGTMDDLDRFVRAQRDTYPAALRELRAARKASHWMWFVFPQIAGLGRSETARRYAIGSAKEARAYLAHPLLGARLVEATRAAIAAAGSADAIFGAIDAVKLRSSMTLFEAVADDPAPFSAALERFFAGERDAATLALAGPAT